MIWTSERETLFLLEKGLPFLGQSGEVYQVIDTSANSLYNVIEFSDGKDGFFVDSTAAVESDIRVSFKFLGACIEAGDRTFKIPPVRCHYKNTSSLKH